VTGLLDGGGLLKERVMRVVKNWQRAALGLAIWSGSVALAAEPASTVGAGQSSQQDLQKQIDALQAQVNELRAKQTPNYTQKDIDAAVASVLQDADKRSTLLGDASGFYGGYTDGKFTIRSADGNYSLSPGVWFQYRYATTWRDNAKSQGGSDTQSGFEARRLKFTLEGNVITPKLTYGFVWATNRSDTSSNVGGGGTGTFSTGGGNLVLEEGWLRYQFADDWGIQAGTYKELIYAETATSSKRKLAVENSLVGEYLFGGDIYTQGVILHYGTEASNGPILAQIAFSDGYSSRNTDFRDPSTNAFDFGVHGRVNYKVTGDWKQYGDASALGNKKDLLVIGGGFDWSQNGDSDVVRWSVDTQYENGSLAVLAAVTGRYTRTAGGGDDLNDFGFLVQAGYLVSSQWEVFGRWSMLELDDKGTTGDTEFCELTAGVNYYFKGHAAKIQLDIGWLPNGSPSNLTSANILSNSGEDEVYIRAQFQLLL